METPLLTALLEHKKKDFFSLHVPGHKNGLVFPELAKDIYKSLLAIDVTELTGLDDLHQPKGVINRAQNLTAALYGVESSYFLINGSTVGNLAMILACCNENDVVLVQRNSHKSILNGIQLVGATPVFLTPKIDTSYQVPSFVEYKTVSEAIRRYPEAKALILTNPNYYGISSDITDIVKLAHANHIPVLVDEAHGAHFIAGDKFPISAIKAGADIVIHSAHKTLPAMTMGSYLHFNSRFVERERISHYLSVLQSSSPSYPIMASLDLARAYIEDILLHNRQDNIISSIKEFKNQLQSIDGIEVVISEDKLVDPLKVTIRSTLGYSGFELQEFFESQGIYSELSDPLNLLFVLPLHEANALTERFTKISTNFSPRLSKAIEIDMNSSYGELESIQQLELSYAELKWRRKRLVTFDEAIGFYVAEAIIPYPPGIPFIMVGEKITTNIIDKLRYMIKSKINIQGNNHINIEQILIFE